MFCGSDFDTGQIEVHRDVDNMPPPVAGMKRKCGGEEETLSGKRQKVQTTPYLLRKRADANYLVD